MKLSAFPKPNSVIALWIFFLVFLLFPQSLWAKPPSKKNQALKAHSFWQLDLEEAKFLEKAKVGYASWYGRRFHGRKTANGERYNQHALTCASKTLPFGTWLEITNLKNGKRAVVRVNDRGPYIKRRILDVSYAVAKKLGFLRQGVAKVAYREVQSPQ